MKILIICLLTFPNLLWAFGSSEILKEPYAFKASVKAKKYTETMRSLRSLDIDIAGVDFNNSIIDVLLNSYELNLLKEKGIELEITWVKGISLNNFVDSDYKTSLEVEEFMKDATQSFPDLTDMIEIGKSVEGKPIWALKISDNAGKRELDEPTILFNSMHHAREVMSPEVSLDIIEYLLSNYKTDSKVKDWVDQNEIWIVPMLNVDGNSKVWGGDSMWRKNTRDGFGVDLNRNYPFGWNSCNGSSGFVFASTYRGPEPASEPETKALMGLVEKIKPVFDISYHSYSELVLYPYGCKNSTGASQEAMKSIGQEMGQLLGYTSGTPWEILYEADGSDIDWMLGEHQVIPYVIELNSRNEGFQPPYAGVRDRTVELNRKAWQLLLDKLSGPGVRGVIENFSGVEYIEVFKNSKLIQSYKINPDGSFHIILAPGKYQLKGNSISTQEIEIKDKRIDL